METGISLVEYNWGIASWIRVYKLPAATVPLSPLFRQKSAGHRYPSAPMAPVSIIQLLPIPPFNLVYAFQFETI